MSAVAENIQTEMPAPILFTDSAAAKVADLIAEEGNPDLKLRVFVQGGGCSGFQYGFTFDEITNEDDTTMTKNGVSRSAGRTVCDQESRCDVHLRVWFVFLDLNIIPSPSN